MHRLGPRRQHVVHQQRAQPGDPLDRHRCPGSGEGIAAGLRAGRSRRDAHLREPRLEQLGGPAAFAQRLWLRRLHLAAGRKPDRGPDRTVLQPDTADAGHNISCSVRATYPLLSVTESAASPAVKIIGPAPVVIPISAPAVSALTLPHQTDRVSSHGALHVTLDCSGAPCSGTVRLITSTGSDRHGQAPTHEDGLGHDRHRRASPHLLGDDKVALKLTLEGLGLLERGDYRLGAGVSISYLTSGGSRASPTGLSNSGHEAQAKGTSMNTPPMSGLLR